LEGKFVSQLDKLLDISSILCIDDEKAPTTNVKNMVSQMDKHKQQEYLSWLLQNLLILDHPEHARSVPAISRIGSASHLSSDSLFRSSPRINQIIGGVKRKDAFNF